MMRTLLSLSAVCLLAGSVAQAGEKDNNVQLISSNKVLDSSVYNANDEAVASVYSAIFDKQGKVHYLVLGIGGIAGIGQEMVAVPASAVNMECTSEDDIKQCKYKISMTAERLKKAPKLKTQKSKELYDPNWVKTNSEFYGTDTSATPLSPDSTYCLRQVTDAEIKGSTDEVIGQLDAVIFDTQKCVAKYAIVGYGGTLGVGESYAAVPFEKLNINMNGDEAPVAQIQTTVENLKTEPQVTPEEYPELDLESVREQVNN